VNGRQGCTDGDDPIEYALFALPIHGGKSAAARTFLRSLEAERKSDYAASEQRLGITRELWAAVRQFVASRDAFDLWFKQQVNDTTRVDLNLPPDRALSDIPSVYDGSAAEIEDKIQLTSV
jgi:hypothetical protein